MEPEGSVTWPGGNPADRLREVMARQVASAMTTTLWRPLTHQVPPAGSWLGWLLMAGRGSGKTDACM